MTRLETGMIWPVSARIVRVSTGWKCADQNLRIKPRWLVHFLDIWPSLVGRKSLPVLATGSKRKRGASLPPAEADGGTETKRSFRRAGDAIPGGAGVVPR